VEPSEVVEWILSIPDIEGITVSGGEPFEQAGALVDIISQMKRVRPELTVFIFSGHEYQTLLQSEEKSVRELIQHSDMLSTGPYIAKLRDQGLLWRGSSNQELHYITERYHSSMEETWLEDSPTEEYAIHNESIQFTGFGGKNSMIVQLATKLIG
jgi:anaerobic ribonucleoside-triphosphate reductase activating protein